MNRPLTLYFSSEILLSTGIGIVQYAQPFYFVSHGASDTTVGLLFAINALCGGLCALLLGPAADRIGASKVWKVSSGLLAMSYLLMAVTHTLTLWVCASALTGFSAALLMSTENVVLSSLSKTQEKASIFSKFVAMYMFVIGAGSIISGWLSTGFGFQWALVIGALVALLAMPLRVFVKAPDTIAHAAFRRPSRRIMAMAGYAGLFGLGSALLNQFATLIVHNQLGMSTHLTALVAAGGTFMVSLGSLFVSVLIRKFQRNPTLALSFIASIGLALGLAATRSPLAYSGMYLARTATSAIPGPIVDAAFLDLTPSTDFSQMFGVRVFGTNIGTAGGSYLGGALLGSGSLLWIALLSAAAFAIAGGYLFVLLHRIAQHPDGAAMAMSEASAGIAPETCSNR